ncbi:nitrogen fixation protein NifQ [Halochromatium sp.]
MPAPARAAQTPINSASTRSGPADDGGSESVQRTALRSLQVHRPGQQAQPPAAHQREHGLDQDVAYWRHWLLSHATGRANDAIIASMLASQRLGLGAMPNWLGLTPEAFADLIADHFPALRQTSFPQPGRQLDPARVDERDELVRLLLKTPMFKRPMFKKPAGRPSDAPTQATSDPFAEPSAPRLGEEPSPEQHWMAGIIAAGCMGSDHLWQDLGLLQRAELSFLMAQNFPALASQNSRDMKWKRFLYKQLCEAEGIYTCRSPSCEVCVDYHACFGPEN